MASTFTGPARHPLLAAVDRIDDALNETAAADPLYLSTSDKAELLTRLARARDRVDARLADALAVSGDVAEQRASRSPGAWLAHERNLPHARLVGTERLGARLRQHPQAASAAADGDISLEHARAITDAIDELPSDIPGCESPAAHAELLSRAERDLVKLAAEHTPKEVRRLGRRILETVAPDAADAIEERLLRAEERRARERTQLRFTTAGAGSTRIRADIPTATADILRKALEAIMNPRRVSTSSTTESGDRSDGRTHAERQGEAFCTLIEHLATDGLPTHGGTPVSIIITIEESKLREGVGAAQLDTGDRLSVTAVRRLACEHGIMPAVLDGQGRVLDLGRSQRFFGAAQRAAHAVTHPDCQADGCRVPASWCEAHHKRAWARGGTTDLRDLAFLCSFHHHRAHDPDYEITWLGEQAHFRRR